MYIQREDGVDIYLKMWSISVYTPQGRIIPKPQQLDIKWKQRKDGEEDGEAPENCESSTCSFPFVYDFPSVHDQDNNQTTNNHCTEWSKKKKQKTKFRGGLSLFLYI